MPRKKLYSLCGIAAAALMVSFLYIYNVAWTPGIAYTDSVQEMFDSEEDYLKHVAENVRFKNLTFAIVEIKKGDNFWKIARAHNVNIDTLLGSNPYWNDLVAKLNQKIIVPSRMGVLHYIYDFDQITDIASLYQTDASNILVQKHPLLYRLYYRLVKNRAPIAIFVPDARPSTLTMTDEMAQKFAVREMFRSPLSGRFSSFFGGRNHPIFHHHSFHNGVDIAAPYGTLVGASCEGVVSSTGWMGGYGLAVIIDHPKGYRTLYGHLSQIFVRHGQRVAAGRLIGKVGSTGWSTGPHLHFTLWHNGRLINPMKVLW